MLVRAFNGGSANSMYIRSLGSSPVTPWGHLWFMRMLTDSAGDNFGQYFTFSQADSAPQRYGVALHSTERTIEIELGIGPAQNSKSTGAPAGITVHAADGAVIMGWNKASGTVVPQFHLGAWNGSSFSWIHCAGNNTIADGELFAHQVDVGFNYDTRCHLLVEAEFGSAMGANAGALNAAFEAFGSLQDIADSPQIAYLARWDQAGDTDAVNDLTPNGSNTTSVFGTTSEDDAAFDGFDMTLAGGAATSRPVFRRQAPRFVSARR